jgi:hypothetical protein
VADSPLAPLIAKLDRADESLRSLNRKLRRVEKAETVTVGTKLDFKTGWHTARIKHTEPLSPQFSVLVGESLYHGRSVLEHLVWALVKANHKKPGKDHTFPVWDVPPVLRGSSSRADAFTRLTKRKQLAGVPLDAIALIEGLQPYNRPDMSTYVLSVLNDMARDDRHHAIHASFVGGRSVPDMESRFRAPRGAHIVEFKTLLRPGQRVVAGTKLARFRLSRHGRYPQVRVEGGVPVFVAFGSRKTRMLLLDAFQEINRRLRGIIEPFAEFL